jgi:hypothetical protein
VSKPLLLRPRSRLRIGLGVALSCIGLVACGGGERQDENEPEGTFPVSIVKAEFPNRQRLAQTSDLVLSIRNQGSETIPDLAITINTFRQGEEEASAEAATEPGEEPSAFGEEEEDPSAGTAEPSAESTQQGGGEAGAEPAPSANGSFSVRSEQEGLAIPSRPVWILEQNYPKLVGETASAGAEAAQTNTYSFGELDPGETREMIWKLTPVESGSYVIDYRVAAGLQGKAVAENADGGAPEGRFVVVISDVPPQTRVTGSGEVVPIKPSDIIGKAGSKQQKQEVGQ